MMLDVISAALRNEGFSIEAFDIIDSTNTYLKNNADCKNEGHIVIAGEQSAGRGRLGRRFFSPEGTGVYMSILLKPELAGETLTYITAAAAVSLSEAIDTISGKTTDIKWVNDIYIGGKKVCGILTEAVFDGDKMKHAVLGIGINVRAPIGGFPDEIKDIAASVFDEADDKTVASLVAAFLKRFFTYYNKLDKRQYLGTYKEKMLYLGENITVLSPTETYEATLVSVNDDFSLNVVRGNEHKRIFTGEISIRKN